jgi:hypothetical protein
MQYGLKLLFVHLMAACHVFSLEACLRTVPLENLGGSRVGARNCILLV